MSGWSELDADAWETTLCVLVAALPPGKLPEEAARIDLRHLESLHRWWMASEGKHGEQWPGLRTMAERWGWSVKRVRTLLATDDWHSPNNPVAPDMLIAHRAKGHSQVHSGGTVEDTVAKGTTPTVAAEGAQSGAQSGHSPGLHARSSYAEEQRTEIPPTPTGAVPEAAKAETPKPDPVREVWLSWKLAYEDFRTRAPQWNLPAVRKTAPNRAEARAIGGRLGEGATVEECQRVVAWALRDGTDDYALGLRGERSFNPDKPPLPYLSVETLFKPKGWETRRMLSVAAPTALDNSPEAEAQRAWDRLPRLFGAAPQGRRNPAAWPDEHFGERPEVQRAFRRSLLDNGGGDMSTDDFTRRRFMASFIRHYQQARSA